MGSGCVIVTLKLLNEDFIFLFSYLIPFFYTVFDNNKKASHVLSLYFFKGQTLVLVLPRLLERQ